MHIMHIMHYAMCILLLLLYYFFIIIISTIKSLLFLPKFAIYIQNITFASLTKQCKQWKGTFVSFLLSVSYQETILGIRTSLFSTSLFIRKIYPRQNDEREKNHHKIKFWLVSVWSDCSKRERNSNKSKFIN